MNFDDNYMEASLDEAESKKKIKITNIALLFIASVLIIFTTIMIVIYINCGGIPDTLVAAVFSCCGFECGALGFIKAKKLQYEGGCGER